MSVWKRVSKLEERLNNFTEQFKRCADCHALVHYASGKYVRNALVYDGLQFYCSAHIKPYDTVDALGRYWRTIYTTETTEVGVNGKEIKRAK